MVSISSDSPHSPGFLINFQDPTLPDILYLHSLREFARAESRPIAYVDITDYLVYFRYSASVSGIQRVVHYLVKYADFSSLSQECCVIYCFTHPETGVFGEASPRKLNQLIEAVDQGSSKEHINRCAVTVLSEGVYSHSLPFRPVDILLIPGGPWATNVQLNLYALEKKRIGFLCYCVSHDLIPLDFPEFVSTSLFEEFGRCYYILSRLVDGYIANSEYSLDAVRRYEKRVSIQRPDSHYKSWRLGDFDHRSKLHNSANVPSELKDFSVLVQGKSFVLTVSTIEPRKNHQSLLRAWRLLHQDAGLGFEDLPALVLAGKIGWNSNTLIAQVKMLQEAGFPIYILDGMSDSSIEWLYSRCLFTVMPSYVEGWGLSITESMMRGKVCLASSSTAMIEASCGIAPLFDPYNTRQLYTILKSFLLEGSLNEYVQKLIEYQPVSWRDSALDFYLRLSEIYISQSSPSHTHRVSEPLCISFDLTHSKSHMLPDLLNFSVHEHISRLGKLPCWRPHLYESMLVPFSDQPWIDFILTNEEYVVSAHIAPLPGQLRRVVPRLYLYEETGEIMQGLATRTSLPEGEFIIYKYIPRGQVADQSQRMIRVVLSYEELRQDSSGRDSRTQCVLEPAPYGLRKISFAKQSN